MDDEGINGECDQKLLADISQVQGLFLTLRSWEQYFTLHIYRKSHRLPAVIYADGTPPWFY